MNAICWIALTPTPMMASQRAHPAPRSRPRPATDDQHAPQQRDPAPGRHIDDGEPSARFHDVLVLEDRDKTLEHVDRADINSTMPAKTIHPPHELFAAMAILLPSERWFPSDEVRAGRSNGTSSNADENRSRADSLPGLRRRWPGNNRGREDRSRRLESLGPRSQSAISRRSGRPFGARRRAPRRGPSVRNQVAGRAARVGIGVAGRSEVMRALALKP